MVEAHVKKEKMMEEQNELNDIILNKNSSTLGNKKVIMAVAALGVVLVTAILLIGTISSNGTDNLPQAALPPAPPVQAQQEVAPVAPSEPLFEDVQVVAEDTPPAQTAEDVALDAVAQKVKAQNRQESTGLAVPPVQVASAPAASVQAAPAPAPAKPAPAKKETVVVAAKPVAQKQVVSQPVELAVAPAVAKVAPEPKQITKPVAPAKAKAQHQEAPKQESVKKETPKQEEPKANASSGVYYIQVGSFETSPDKKLIDAISKSGHQYKIQDVTADSKSVHKVLVGPFSTEAEVRKAIGGIRSSVEPRAFVIAPK